MIDIVKKIRKCEFCQKEYDSELGYNNHMNKEHKGQASSTMNQPQKLERFTEPLDSVIEHNQKELKLEGQEYSKMLLEKNKSKLEKELGEKLKDEDIINKLVKLKEIELLTSKPQTDGFSTILPLLLQQNQQSFLAQQENSNKMFQVMMSQQDKQSQMMLESFKLQSQIQNNGFQNIGSLLQTVNGIKEFATQIGWAEDKTQSFIQSTISQALDKISPTLLQPLGEALSEKIRRSGGQQHNSVNVASAEAESISEGNGISEPIEIPSYDTTKNHFHQGTYISEPTLKEILRKELREDYSDLIDLGDNRPEPKRIVKTADEELQERFGV